MAPMLGKVYSHFIRPRAQLARETLVAAVRGQSAFRVAGQNMEPTLPVGSVCRFRPLSSADRLDTGTMVALAMPDFGPHIVPSRIIGVGGDRVRIEHGRLLLNGRHLPEPFVHVGYASSEYSTEFAEATVPDGAFFVLGDYRDASKDSRLFGPVSRAAIVGVIIAPPTTPR